LDTFDHISQGRQSAAEAEAASLRAYTAALARSNASTSEELTRVRASANEELTRVRTSANEELSRVRASTNEAQRLQEGLMAEMLGQMEGLRRQVDELRGWGGDESLRRVWAEQQLCVEKALEAEARREAGAASVRTAEEAHAHAVKQASQ
jgi:hypothetical protein